MKATLQKQQHFLTTRAHVGMSRGPHDPTRPLYAIVLSALFPGKLKLRLWVSTHTSSTVICIQSDHNPEGLWILWFPCREQNRWVCFCCLHGLWDWLEFNCPQVYSCYQTACDVYTHTPLLQQQKWASFCWYMSQIKLNTLLCLL